MKKNVKRNDKKLHKLRYWRSVIGASQEDFAVLIGCKRSNYCSKENGNTEIFLSEEKKIKEELNKRLIKMGLPTLSLDDIFLP